MQRASHATGIEGVRVDMACFNAHAGHKKVEGLDHGRCSTQVGAPADQGAQVLVDGVGDEATALACATRSRWAIFA